MKKRLTKKASWFKGNNFTAEDELYVGIDVHKEQYHVAIWHSGRIGCIYSIQCRRMAAQNRHICPVNGYLWLLSGERGPPLEKKFDFTDSLRYSIRKEIWIFQHWVRCPMRSEYP